MKRKTQSNTVDPSAQRISMLEAEVKSLTEKKERIFADWMSECQKSGKAMADSFTHEAELLERLKRRIVESVESVTAAQSQEKSEGEPGPK